MAALVVLRLHAWRCRVTLLRRRPRILRFISLAIWWCGLSLMSVSLSVVAPMIWFDVFNQRYSEDGEFLTQKARPHWRVLASKAFGRQKLIATSGRILLAPDGFPSFWYESPVREFAALEGFDPSAADRITIEQIGWPMFVLRGYYVDVDRSMTSSTFMHAIARIHWREAIYETDKAAMHPLGVQIDGLLVNGGGGATLALSIWLGSVWLLRKFRRSKQCCIICGYPLCGLSETRPCPECGAGSAGSA